MVSPLDSRRGSSGSEIANGAAPWVSPKRAPTGTPKAVGKGKQGGNRGLALRGLEP